MTEIKGYHAHVYYSPDTRKIAETLRDTILEKFAVKPGAFSDLIHPLTESSYDDHSKNALWIGTPVPMRLDILRPAYRPELLPTNSAA